MQEQTHSIASVLTRTEQAHGAVFHYVGGDDADWASFYADFLINHSPLPAMLATPPIRGHLRGHPGVQRVLWRGNCQRTRRGPVTNP